MIKIRNFQKDQFPPNTILEQKCNNTYINNFLKQDTVSFKMSYGDYSHQIQEEAPKIDNNKCIINMGRKSTLHDQASIKIIDKDLKLNRKSTLVVNPYNCLFKTVKVNSLEMEKGSQIQVLLGLPFQVGQNTIINENCTIDAKNVIFNGQTTIGNNFVTENIQGEGNLDIGNDCRIGSIDTQCSKLTIRNFAKIANIKAANSIDIGHSFTPTTPNCNIVSDKGSIYIGRDIQQYKQCELQGLTNSNGLCLIQTIKTPTRLYLEKQTQNVINKIEAGSIFIMGDVTVNKVELEDSIINHNIEKNAILTVLKDVLVPSSTKPDKNREITIENTVIKEDFIIDKNSGVTKLNLKNVKISGALVLENPNVEVVKDDKTDISEIYMQQD